MTKLTRYTMIVGAILTLTIGVSSVLAGPREISPQGTCYVVALFAKFSNETPDQTDLPDYAEHLFDADRPGSFTHFYHEMSLGRFAVEGSVLPKYYTSDRPASAYPRNEKEGYVGIFNREVLKKADQDVDFGCFDNDGPDGVPNSGDDDGYVDYLFILVEGEYPGFLPGTAAGIAGLKLGEEDFVTNDRARIPSEYIKIASTHGATQKVSKYSAVGIMAHEFGHAPGLDLPDLYDDVRQGPEDDSAGIGVWGLMGRGALGWNGHDGPADGPVPFSAWSRVQLGWANVVEITGQRIGQVLTDVATTGTVYKIPAGGSYYLLENRQSTKSYYDRNIPGSGLLIWHIQSSKTSNSDELNKGIDLVCADGLYRGRGYPDGEVEDDPRSGRDNLDFWAHDEYGAYRSDHNGNLGDETDPFDGIRFTAFTPETNPSSRGDVKITDIRPSGTDLIADIRVPTWSGSIVGEVVWKGVVNVVGDIVVEKGAMLTMSSGTEVRFSPTDALQGGSDPDRCEIDVFGTIRFIRSGKDSIYFKVEGEGTWPGIRLYEGIASTPIYSPTVNISWGDCDVPEGVFWVTEAEVSSPPIEEREMEHSDDELVTDIGENDPLHPRSFALSQNVPNPFNAETVISFELPRSMDITLTIFNALGQMIQQWQGSWTAGHHSLTWSGQDEDGAPVGSGVYLYRLQADNFAQTHAATLLR